MMTTSDPITPDAVERAKLLRSALCAAASDADEIRATLLAERARHAEEVARLRDVHLDETRALDDLRLKEIASLRDQLRRTEGARDVATRVAADHFGTICQLRDQLRKVEGERDEALRMVDGLRKSEKTARESMVINMRLRDEAQAESVRLKAERDALRSLLPDVRACAEYVIGEFPENHPAALTGSRILAALDSQGGEGE